MTKSVILSFLGVFLAFSSLNGQVQLNAEVYQNAEKALWWNTNPLIDRMNVRPNWQEDGSFW